MSSLAIRTVPTESDEQVAPEVLSRPLWLPDELFPFTSRCLDVGGARIHYIDEGSGPLLLLLHGSPMWSFMYRKLISQLRSSFRCIALDLPGLGLSRAPLVHGRAFSRNADCFQACVRKLDLQDATLVVHATAGPSAFEMAIRERERFRALAISNSFAWPLEGDRKLEAVVRLVSSRLFAWANIHLNLLGRLTAQLGRRVGRFSGAEKAAVLGPYRDKEARRHLQNILLGVRTERDFFLSLERRLGVLVDLPVLLLYGVYDNGYAAGFLERFQSHLPRHEVTLLPKSGHFPLEDEPEAFIKALGDWWTRVVS